MPKTEKPEAPVQRGCLQILAAKRIFHWRSNNIPAFDRHGNFRKFAGMKGSSDIIGCLPWGRFLAVECKAPAIPLIGQRAGRLTPEQREFLEAINRNGGVGVCISDHMVLLKLIDSLLRDPDARFDIYGQPLKA
ncbi:VRR-NUC domain-containing protein [Singulisphaera sp. PoT]|uniref:VRR-NUC domain-containing protein n=1 Tax=Singulisphaera sp. PoT TaxID=3411797 RepID=UPI003BF483D7